MHRFLLSAALCLLLPGVAQAQVPAASASVPLVYTYAEKMPQLPEGGGALGLSVAVNQRILYPMPEMRDNTQGKVTVAFTVTPAGSVEDIKIIKSLTPNCDSAVVRAVRQLPTLLPGEHEGKIVAVRVTVPVVFRIISDAQDRREEKRKAQKH